MDSKDHGNSIITQLRLLVDLMGDLVHSNDPVLKAEKRNVLLHRAECLLPLAEVDEVEVIILREASAIANARGDNALAERLETLATFIADEQAG